MDEPPQGASHRRQAGGVGQDALPSLVASSGTYVHFVFDRSGPGPVLVVMVVVVVLVVVVMVVVA